MSRKLIDNYIQKIIFQATINPTQGVVKFLRAQGGCLGRNRRRRTWQAAKSFGETQTVDEPEMSEWGNPAAVWAVTHA